MAFSTFVGIVALLTTLVAGDLVQWPRPSVANRVILLSSRHRCVVLRPLAWTGVGQLDERERRAADGGHRLCLVQGLLWKRRLFRSSHRQFKTRVHKFTGFSFWTEAHQVIHTDHPSCVSVSAVRTVFAEASVIPGTVFDLGLGIDVQEWTFLVAALAKLGVEVAFRHLGHVVFMEELALVSLLTQSSEPVLTHHRLLSTDVTERTHPTFNTSCSHEELTHSRSGLVHAGEGQRLCAKLLLHSDFQVKLDMIHVSQYVLHVCVSLRSSDQTNLSFS